jgi:hypothetical protein
MRILQVPLPTRCEADGVSEGAQAATPLRMVEVAVQENPEYPYIEERFDAIAESVMSIANLPGDKYSIGIAPMAKMLSFFPMGNNAGAIGHDLMDPCQVCRRTPQDTPAVNRAIFFTEVAGGVYRRRSGKSGGEGLSWGGVCSTFGLSGVCVEAQSH